jgi:hypothetical protein
MYGSVMIAKIKGDPEEILGGVDRWKRQVPGYIRGDALLGDDGQTIVLAVQFDSKDKYLALAAAPEQDEWFRAVVAPVLDGEPTWIDGTWLSYVRSVPGPST